MAKEIHLFGKKKDAYPTKTTINFYIKEDKTTGVSTVLLYVIFAIVVLVALGKVLVFDLVSVFNIVLLFTCMIKKGSKTV